MIALLSLLLGILDSPFKPNYQLEAENVALPHQVAVLQCQMRGRVRLTSLDRLVLSSFAARFRQSFGLSHAILRRLHHHYSRV